MIEVFVRLGMALLLSLALALLLAWGWDSSDRAAMGQQALENAGSNQHAGASTGSGVSSD